MEQRQGQVTGATSDMLKLRCLRHIEVHISISHLVLREISEPETAVTAPRDVTKETRQDVCVETMNKKVECFYRLNYLKWGNLGFREQELCQVAE